MTKAFDKIEKGLNEAIEYSDGKTEGAWVTEYNQGHEGEVMDSNTNNTEQHIIMLELWNHGTAGELIKPCGDIDIFSVSGEKIHRDLLEELLSNESFDNKFQWFCNLPTEQALLVEAEVVREEDEYWLFVKSWKELEE